MATDANTSELNNFVFPAWVNKMVLLGLACAGLIGGYVATVGFFATHPKVINVGHMPEQPVPFSHALHAGKLKLDCRYCHNTVEKAAHAAIPPTATCGNCHGGKDRVKQGANLAAVHLQSEKLAPVRASLETGDPIEWLRVHEVPGFVYFNHSAHVTQGVSCVECHGRIDKMEVVFQAKPLSMKWCIDCHRDPDEAIRPVDQVTNLGWNPQGEALNRVYIEELGKAYDHFASIASSGDSQSSSGGSQSSSGDSHSDTEPEEAAGDDQENAKKMGVYYEKNLGLKVTSQHSPVIPADLKLHQNAFVKMVFGDKAVNADKDESGDISREEAIAYMQEFRSSPTRRDLGKLLRGAYRIEPNQSCSTCHR